MLYEKIRLGEFNKRKLQTKHRIDNCTNKSRKLFVSFDFFSFYLYVVFDFLEKQPKNIDKQQNRFACKFFSLIHF